jgi:signal transduction histidine kinase
MDLRRGLRMPPSEVALATVVTAVMCVDLGQAAHPLLALPLTIAAGATLAVRVGLPELPLLATCLLQVLLMTTAPGEFGPQTVFIGAMVAVYSAAVHLSGRRAQVAGAVALVLLWVAHVASREGELADFLPFVVWGAPWLVGRLARRQALHARAEGEQAAARLAEQEERTREAAQAERDRIARELHDVVAHAVSLMVVQAGAERLAHPESPSREALQAIEDNGRRALVELRAMLGVLRSTEQDHEPQPDLTTLPALVEQVRGAGLPVELTVRGDASVPAGLALSAYRIVQEGLTNVLRHAGKVPTSVTVEVGPEAVGVEIRNETRAQPRPATRGSGRGLAGMRERVSLHGGTVTSAREDAHWVVRAHLPLAPGGLP